MQTLPPFDPTPRIIERFWSFVARTEDDDSCWEWQGQLSTPVKGSLWQAGLMKIKSEGKFRRYKAHRVAFVIQHGYWPSEYVCHTCDNPTCVRGSHLFEGTAGDNIRDMWAKGRASRHLPPPQHGADNPNAKLSWDMAAAIRREYTGEPGEFQRLGRKYNVSHNLIRSVIRNESYITESA